MSAFRWRLVFVAALVCAAAEADERLLGSWIGAGAENQGDRVTVEREAVIIEGERLPLRFAAPGVLEIGPPGDSEQLRYSLQGDTLTTESADGRLSWTREGAARPAQPTPQPARPTPPQPAPAEPFAGTFSGDGLTLTLQRGAQGYSGELVLQGKRYPATAQASGRRLTGSFTVDGHAFEFNATLEGRVLTLVSGTATYRLQAPARPANGGNAQPSAAGPGQVLMVEHRLKDPGSRNMESHVLLAPKGWTVSGGAWWANKSYFNVLPSRDIKVTSPEGVQVHLAPSILAKDYIPPPDLNVPRAREGTADKGLPVIYLPESLEAWKQWIATRGIPTSYPGATKVRVDNAVVVPELTAVLRKQIEWRRAMLEQQAQQDASVGLRTFIDAQVLAFECSYTHQGQAWDELTIFGLSWEGIEGRLTGRATTWSLNPVVVYRAPEGQLDAQLPLLVAIVNTCQVTPQWSRMRAELQAKLIGIAQKGAADANKAAMDRSRMLAKYSSDISDIIHKGYQERNAIRDETQRKVINSIRGTEDYVVPGGSTSVQLPNDYRSVYTNGNGEYLLTNDALYDPNTDPALNSQQWTGMQPQR